MQHVFSCWREIVARIKTSRHIFLLSDYDGTLTPIVERPEMADIPPATRELLQDLAHLKSYTVGIISGRALKDLEKRVGIRGIIYAGNHGLEIEGPGISFVNPVAEEIKPVFRLMHGVLSSAFKTIKGVIVENKGLTLSVHYRMADDDKADEVKNIFERVVDTARTLGRIRVTSGKKVLEIRPPVAWDKGKAIEMLLQKHQMARGTVPIFLGDDLTDEDGFKVINEYQGISIFVGEESGSAAHYFLRSPAEVEEFLRRLLAEPTH